jgi:predicted nuclease of predicted toxin-antitoxin system
MNFLLNMNVNRDMAAQLKKRGHVCRHAGDVGMARATDAEIVAEAKKTREVILTHDLDYGHLLAFSGEEGPSVVILRLRDLRTEEIDDIYRALEDFLQLQFHLHEVEKADFRSLEKCDHYIHIAVRTKIVAQD